MLKLLWSKTEKLAHSASVVEGAGQPAAGSVEQPSEQTAASVSEPLSFSQSRIVGVLGVKGGVGASTIALNLAVAFAREQRFTTLLDANLQQPDIASMLGVEPENSIVDLLSKDQLPDQQLLTACCIPISSTLPCRLLSPPAQGQAALQVDLTRVGECLDSVRKYSACWVIDLPHHLDRHLVSVLDRCDTIVLVFEPTLTCLAALRRWLKVALDLGYPEGRIILAMNRSGSSIHAVEQEAAGVLTGRALFKLPNAFKLSQTSTAEGLPAMLRKSGDPYCKAIRTLASAIIEQRSGCEGPSRNSSFIAASL
jgi:pilus assembly protein CpaE